MNENKIFSIYDKIFKKILTLSSTAIINLINGMFGTNHPTNSKITYNWTEFENENLKKILADTIVTINDTYSYHMEAQMTKDNSIVFRMFEYGYSHANRQPNHENNEIIFPEPIIIYLYYEGNVPDEYALTLNFGSQGCFDYKVKTFKYLDISAEELDKRKMIILIPFQLLKLRKIIEKERSKENFEQLKKLINDDIIRRIEDNCKLGNITTSDANRLRNLTQLLYNHIYSHYYELEDITEMDQSIILDIDEMLDEYDAKLAEKEQRYIELSEKMAEKEQSLNTLNQRYDELNEQNAELNEQNAELNEQNAELKLQIELLKKQLN